MISKKQKVSQLLDQARDFLIEHPMATQFAGAGLGYLAGEGLAAVGNAVIPGDQEFINPGFFSGIGFGAGALHGGEALARALARRGQA